MNKTAIKNFAIWARRKLISDITYKAGMLGITENGIAQPMKQSTRDLQFFDIGTKDYVEISGVEIQQRNALLAAIRDKEKTSDYKTAFRGVVEEVAYTWFNRLIAVRFMEVNDYLPSHIRVLSSENPNKREPDFVTSPFDANLDLSPYEKDVVLQLKDQNKLDELFRMLFIKQCNKLSHILPELFEKISDYTELLLTISFTDKDGVIYHLTHDISEDDFNVEKEGQVEIIGWMYQYYNTEPKDKVFENLKKNIKIRKEDIPAATQLFTPDWIVRYMVENSLGRLWVEGHPNDDLKATWKYYLEEAEQEPDVQVQLAKIWEEYAKINPEDIKLIDPCMGSGHILVYAFDVLMQIYTSYGYTQRDAAKSILEKNLYGIDIDTRAYQLAYFAVMMKARQYNRRIFSEGILPNLMAVKNPTPCTSSSLKRLGDLKDLGKRLIEDFTDAEEFGSILQLNYSKEELDALDNQLAEIHEMSSYGDLLSQLESDECVNTIAPLVRQARIMGQKYDVVVTNPPYMGGRNMNARLLSTIVEKYPEGKADLYAAFILQTMKMTKVWGYQALITMHSWMFLSSFEQLRKIMLSHHFVAMNHLGSRAFEEISGEVVQTTTWVLRKTPCMSAYTAKIVRLLNYGSQKEKETAYIRKAAPVYCVSQQQIEDIPGMAFGYWLDNPGVFTEGKLLEVVANPRQGLKTLDNDYFLRLWFEVDRNQMQTGANNAEEAIRSKKKWFPINHGGEFRKYYGNNLTVVNWENDGSEMKANAIRKYNSITRTITNIPYYFKEGITWSVLCSEPSFRWYGHGYLFSNGGQCIVPDGDVDLLYLTGLLNSKISGYLLNMLSPTMGFESGYLKKLPIISSEEYIEEVRNLAKENILLSKAEWDDYECSWDFEVHPLVRGLGSLPERYSNWEKVCDERFYKIKNNDERLNTIFISVYRFTDSLSSDVSPGSISVRVANKQRDIRSLISYAVGCIFGRYSLDHPGLSYAGGKWEGSKYHSFLPDADNCIPITDEEYFQDDIVGRFVEFIRTVYGAATLEENLEFIADALGNEGKTSRDTIRQYFLKDFFADHLKIYQKRPIYWLFDSGKQNGFKALVYMHRWNADTVGNLRVEYLHKMQTVYEKEIDNCQDAIDNSLNNREIAAATKRKEKLIKQLKECKDYDAKVAHIALSRIDIDLDDGVKVNYRKVQTGADGRFCEILADSKDIMVKEDSPIWQSLISNK